MSAEGEPRSCDVLESCRCVCCSLPPPARPTPRSGCGTRRFRRTVGRSPSPTRGTSTPCPASGGLAAPVTISESYDVAPVWSHDGKSIAFASDRYGNFDVYVMPSTGGEARRLTFHSGDETPCDVHGRRQGRAVLRVPAGCGHERPVPHLDDGRAVQRSGRRRPRHAGAAGAGAERHVELHRRQADLPRHQGLRERLAQAPHLGGHARHLGLRLQDREIRAAHAVPRRGPQPGLRHRRRRRSTT